jgi:hypothetical protein
VTLTRLVILLVAVAALVAAAPSLLDSTENVRDQLSSLLEDHGGGGQSAEQISSGEFAAAAGGMKADALRSLVGKPDERTTAKVEGLDLECWYYGVAGGTGAYQFCFVDGKLSSKRRYAATPDTPEAGLD